MEDELLQEIKPDSPSHYTHYSQQMDSNPVDNNCSWAVFQVCANCCSSLNYSTSNNQEAQLNSSQHQYHFQYSSNNHLIANVAANLNVNKMLSEIYNLIFIPRLQQKYYYAMMESQEVDFPLCWTCTNLLNSLFSLYSQFNQIRKIDSLLSKQINLLNSLINYDPTPNQNQQSNQDRQASCSNETLISMRNDIFNTQEKTTTTIAKTTTNNSSSSSSKKFKFPSNDLGPWVKVGPRLEDLTVEDIGYAPPSLRHLYQEAPQNKLILYSDHLLNNQSPSLSSHDDENDNDMDYQPSPISDPLFYNEEDLNVDIKPDLGLDSEFPRKLRKSPRKSSSSRRSKPKSSTTTTTTTKRKKPTKRVSLKGSKPKPWRKKTVFVKEDEEETGNSENSIDDDKDDNDDEYLPPSAKNQILNPGTGNNDAVIETAADDDDDNLKSASKQAPKRKRRDPSTQPPQKKIRGAEDFPCPICPFTTKYVGVIKKHMNDHAEYVNKSKCSECDKVFKTPYHCRVHFIRTHTESGRISYEKRKEKIHAKKTAARNEAIAKGFVCRHCGVDFLTRLRHTNHLRTVHDDYGNSKLCVCETCGKKFTFPAFLRKHLSDVHTEERHFICEQCGASFKSAGNLRTHRIKVHTEEGRKRNCEYTKAFLKDKIFIEEQKARIAAAGSGSEITRNVSGSAQVPETSIVTPTMSTASTSTLL